MAQVFIGVGSNCDPARQLRLAVQELAARFGNVHPSTVYRSSPIGVEGPDFLNLVLGFDTVESPQVVAAVVKDIEHRQNEQSQDICCLSRAIDLDFLMYEDQVISSPGLTLPRDDILRYAFVLRPLAEIAPSLRHPVTGECLAEMWVSFPVHTQPLHVVELDLL